MEAIVEAAVSDNWAAVAEAIRARVAELGVTQKDLSVRSGVSESTIRQLMNNYGPRRRSRHTLADVARGLQWPANHLEQILGGPENETQSDGGSSVQAELSALRDRVDELTNRVEALEHGRSDRQ